MMLDLFLENPFTVALTVTDSDGAPVEDATAVLILTTPLGAAIAFAPFVHEGGGVYEATIPVEELDELSPLEHVKVTVDVESTEGVAVSTGITVARPRPL